MDELGKIVKVVAGASGSKRITIPKKISDHINLKAGEFVYVTIDGNEKIVIEPVQFISRN